MPKIKNSASTPKQTPRPKLPSRNSATSSSAKYLSSAKLSCLRAPSRRARRFSTRTCCPSHSHRLAQTPFPPPSFWRIVQCRDNLRWSVLSLSLSSLPWVSSYSRGILFSNLLFSLFSPITNGFAFRYWGWFRSLGHVLVRWLSGLLWLYGVLEKEKKDEARAFYLNTHPGGLPPFLSSFFFFLEFSLFFSPFLHSSSVICFSHDLL